MGKLVSTALPVQELLRLSILAVFIVGMTGTGLELVLLEHTEDTWQWIPLILMLLSIVVLIGYGITKAPRVLRIFQLTMILFVVSGFLGIWFHYKGTVEFEMEMYPSMKGLELFYESIKGATPALAPGTMVQLGLLGLIYTFRHPRFSIENKKSAA